MRFCPYRYRPVLPCSIKEAVGNQTRLWTGLWIQQHVLPAALETWSNCRCKDRVFSRITAGTISVWTPRRGTRHQEAANMTSLLALQKEIGPDNWQPEGKLLPHTPLLHKPAETRNTAWVKINRKAHSFLLIRCPHRQILCNESMNSSLPFCQVVMLNAVLEGRKQARTADNSFIYDST